MKKKTLQKFLSLTACFIVLCVIEGQHGACSIKRYGNPNTEETYHAAPRKSTSQAQPTNVPTPLMAAPIANEIVLEREGYTCSYNPDTRQPNYVSWALTPFRLDGKVKRTDSFSTDPDLNEQQQSKLEDYKFSGYSRGHMCPAADNKWSLTAMEQSFFLSNICPQTQTLNGGDWEELESTCRTWVKSGCTTLYIVCGPLFAAPPHRKLHKRIPVPEKFFKAIMCLDKGKEKGIAFVYSNNTESHPMDYYVCTIDSVEKITGYNLFQSVPQHLQNKLEASANIGEWR